MDENKEQIMQEVNDKLAELTQLEQMEKFLKSNVNEFLYHGETYRVRKPNNVEKDDANKERMKRYLSMLKDDAYMFRKQLVELLKKKGVDIPAMEQKMRENYIQEQDMLKRLAKAEDIKDIETLKNRVTELRYEQERIFMEKEELLKYCIEKQLEDFVRFYLIYLVLEKKLGDNWEKVFKTYADFEKSEDDLLTGRAAQVLAALVYNEKL